MPTYSFSNEPLGLSLELDFENEPTKQDIYDVIKTQVDSKQVIDLIDGSDDDKAFAIDAYRSGFFNEPEQDVDVLDIIGETAGSFARGVGELIVDNNVASSRLKSLAKASGGLVMQGGDIPISYSSPAMPVGMQLVDKKYPGEIDSKLQKQFDKASVRVLEDSLRMNLSWEDQDAQNTLTLALAGEGLDIDDKNIRAEVSRRANDLLKLKNRATLYQTISNYAGGYALLGSLAKRELNQSDWLSSEQSDEDVMQELMHLRNQQEIMSVMEKGAITGAQVVQQNNISDSRNFAEFAMRSGIAMFGGDKKTAKRTEEALRRGLIQPDHDQALVMEIVASPENPASAGLSIAGQVGVRKLAVGQLNRLNNEILVAKKSFDEAKVGLKNLRQGRQVNQNQVNLGQFGPDDAVAPENILDPKTFKEIESSLETQLKDSKKILDDLTPKLYDKINKFSKPPLLRKGLGAFTKATGIGADFLGRTAQVLRGLPKELAVDMVLKANKRLTPESAEALVLGVAGLGGGAYGAFKINEETWQPDWWDALTAVGFMFGPQVMREGGQLLKHTGNHWMGAQGSKNLAMYVQQLNSAPSVSEAIVDRGVDNGFMHTLRSTKELFDNTTKAKGINPKIRSVARGATATGVDKVGDFIARTATATAQGSALPGAIGYAVGGEAGMASAIGASSWFVASGIAGGEYVRAKSINDIGIKQRGDISNYSQNLSDSQLSLYQRLTPENQAGVASISQKYPDLEIKLIDDPDGGNGAYHFRHGSPVAYVNVSGDAPLTNILAHEVGHHILKHGMSPLVHEIYFGNVASEKPGVFTALDEDGKPIIEYDNGLPRYKLNDEFEKVRDAYVERLENTPGIDEDTRMGYSTNPDDILEEVVAEHVAHLMINDKNDPGILNQDLGQLAKSFFSAISGKGFTRDAGVGLGLVTNEFGNGLLPIKENKQLSKLIKDFESLSSRRSEGEMADMFEENYKDDITNVTPVKLKNNPALQRLFNNQIVLDKDGNPELTLTGLPKLMTNAQANKRAREMSNDLGDLIEKAGDRANGHVVMREGADGKMMGEGLFIDDSIINELAKSGKYNASQINYLRQVSEIGRRMGEEDYNGNEVLMFYYPAMKGGKYKSLRGGYRSMLLWGMKVSKADNVYLQTLSLTAMENNLTKMLNTKKYSKDLYEAFGGDSQIELRKNIRNKFKEYLNNHHKGRSNDSGEFGVNKKQKNIINVLMGENVKAQREANPYFNNVKFKLENAIKSRRIDRIGSIETTSKGGFVDYYKIKNNQMPKVRLNSNQMEMDFNVVAEQNPTLKVPDDPMDNIVRDRMYVKKLASSILDETNLSTDDASMIEGLALTHAEEHSVMPSDLEEQLYKQFFRRAGYKMPRLDGLNDNGFKALEVVGQDRFSVQQWDSALSKVPGARAYMEDLGLNFHTQPAKSPYGKDVMLTKEQIAKAIESNKLSFSTETFRGSAGHYAGSPKLSTPGRVTSDNDYVEMLTYFKGGGKYGDPLGLDIDYKVIVKDENIDAFKELFEKSGIDVELVGKYKDSEIYASEQGLTDELFPMARPETSEDRGAFNLFKFKFGADSVDLNRRSFASQYQDTRDKFNQTLIKNLLEIHNEKKSFDESEVEYANKIAQSFEVVDENPIERPGIRFSDIKGHWRNRPNVFAWSRATGRRNDAEGGKKVRHMEEVQSDWQKLYRDQQGRLPSERLNIPEPPMQSNWYQLAIKRQMLEAFDNGFDQFSFTQGRVQNDRYDLSDQINIIDYYDGKKYMGGDYIQSGNKDFEPLSDYRVVGLDLSNHGYQRLVTTKDGMILDTLDDFNDAVGKPLSDIVGKAVADKILGIKEGEKFDPVRKVPPALKKIVDKKHGVLEKVLNNELAGLRKGRKRMPLPEDEMAGSLIDDYEFAIAKKGIDEFDDILEEIYGTPDLDKIQAQIKRAKDPEVNEFSYENVQIKLTEYIKKGTDVIKKVQGNEILTYLTDLDPDIIGDAIDMGILSSADTLYQYFDSNYDKHYNNVVIKGTSPDTKGLSKNLQNQGRIGSYKPEGLDFQDPKLIRFYDGVIRKAVDKMAKKMGVEKTRSISFDDEDPNLQDGWVIDLPKNREKIEQLGLFMPRLGDEDQVFTPDLPLVASSRSLNLSSRYADKTIDQVNDELTEAERGLSEYARSDENLEMLDPEGSSFISSRNNAISNVQDLKEVMGMKMMPRLRDEFFEWEWASDAVQNFMTHNGKPYFAKKIDESYYPQFWFHGGDLGFKFHPEGDFRESPKGAWAVGNPDPSLSAGGKGGLQESADALFLSSSEIFSEGYQLEMSTGSKRRRIKELRPERPQEVKDINNENTPRPLRVITNVSNVFDARKPKHQTKLIKFLKKHGIDDFMWNSVAHKQNHASTSPYFDKKLAEKHFREKISDPMNNWGTLEELGLWNDGQSFFYDGTKPKFADQSVLRAMGYEAFVVTERGTENLAVYNSNNIKLWDDAVEVGTNHYWGKDDELKQKSRIGLVKGSFDPDEPDIRYMPLVNLPGTNRVKYKQNQNLIPVAFDDISRIAGKYVTFVEADRHDTDGVRMGGPLHAFLKSNDVIVNVDGQNFRPQWANLTWKTMRGMIERVKMTDDGHALISIMKEDAHRSNKDMFSRVAEAIEGNRPNMSQAELEVVANIMSYAIKSGNTKIENPTKSQKNFAKAVGSYKSQLTRGKNANAQVLFDKLYKTYSKTDWWKDQLATDLMTDFRNGIDLGASFKARAEISKIFMKNDAKSTNMPFIPDISALIQSEMDYPGAKLNDVVGVVQLSKHKLDSPDRVFAVYTGKDPTEASFMTNNEREALKQLQADPNFRVHPSYDWLMLGPGNADFFMLNKPVDPVGIMTKEFVNNHEMKWRDKVTKMESKLIERFGRTSAKRGDSTRVKSSFEKFEKEKNKTPLPKQSKSNILGAFLRYEGGVPKVK